MKTYGLINHSHLMESAAAAREQQPKFYWYEEAGVLGPTAVRPIFIHTLPDMLARAGKPALGPMFTRTRGGRTMPVGRRARGVRQGVLEGLPKPALPARARFRAACG